MIPQLKKISEDVGGNTDIDKLIADIEASKDAPSLVSLKDFIAKAATNPNTSGK